MTIRTDADIQRLREDGALTSAEKTLIANCRAGEPTRLGEDVPDGPSDARSIRADLLRYLITGGRKPYPTQDAGVTLRGAYVTGGLDLSFATAKGATGLFDCQFAEPIKALQARFELLSLNRSHLPGLNAQGAWVTGSASLREVDAEGPVRLSSAKIGGQLSCVGARFSNSEGKAFNAQKMEVGEFHWREVTSVTGSVDLTGARVADLVDDAASWELVDELPLNGFRYDRIHGPVTAQMRLRWLAKDAATAGEFRPQPYEQLAHVMQSMGHTSDARRVRLRKEILLARDWRRRATEEQVELRARRDTTPRPPDHNEIQKRLTRIWLDLRVMPVWHGVLRSMVGYGHAPQRVLAWAGATIGVTGLFYLWVWNFGGIVPNSAIVLTSSQWATALAENPDFPALAWINSETGQHYETFNAFAYAADVFIPLVDLGQEAAWTATTATVWGSLAWVLSWFLKLSGWIVTAVGAAAITGIIRRE